MMTSPTLTNALAFAARGFAVLPLHSVKASGESELACACGDPKCGSKGKHPFTRLAPHGLKDATTDIDVVRQWFTEAPMLNFGVITDNLPTIDIDPRHGGDKAWLKLIRENHDVHTWRVITGGGGQHIMFSADKPLPCGKLVRGVDTKGVAGYIVGVGSMHASGKRYRWAPQCSPMDFDDKMAPPASVPAWILGKFKEKEKEKTTDQPRTTEFYNNLLAPALPGERRERVLGLLGHLYGSVLPNKGVLLGLVISHVRLTFPDLEGFGEDEIVGIARDLMQREHRKQAAE
jgi:Bifunctional DNA primase/polymerase, N-terminal